MKHTRCSLILALVAIGVVSLLAACSEGNDDSTDAGQDTEAVTDIPIEGLSLQLGRPTDDSVALSLMADRALEAFVEYGDSSENYIYKTGVESLAANTPLLLNLTSLQPDRRYFYRLCYRSPGESLFTTTAEYSFHTQRPVGKTFVFNIQADPHYRDPIANLDVYKRTLANELADAPDFILDLGDTFMCEKYLTTSYQETADQYLSVRSLFGLISPWVPLFLVNGNHEGELGWKWGGTEDEIAYWATRARQTYFLNPVPDHFYSGNETVEELFGLRQNYYAWEWGEALFVVLDPYWYTEKDPVNDLWQWTLGDDQYHWFESVLKTSQARFKFVFSHHLLGNVRGGIRWTKYYEWGGFNEQNIWEFESKRPGWDLPIHQLMMQNKVTIFFHGHDHLYAREEIDGVVYQVVPQPSNPNYKKTETNLGDEYGYVCVEKSDCQSSSGHLRVTVTPEKTTVEYVRAFLSQDETGERVNGKVYATYDISAQ